MTNSTLAVLLVLGLVAALAWLMRSGKLLAMSGRTSAIAVETAASLGERRQLVIVSVEGRRFLLGVTTAQVSLVTELAPPTPPTEVMRA